MGSAGSQRAVAHVCLRRSGLVAVAPQVLVPLPTSREIDRQNSQVPGTHKGVAEYSQGAGKATCNAQHGCTPSRSTPLRCRH
jgi:hypothetical protein